MCSYENAFLQHATASVYMSAPGFPLATLHVNKGRQAPCPVASITFSTSGQSDMHETAGMCQEGKHLCNTDGHFRWPAQRLAKPAGASNGPVRVPVCSSILAISKAWCHASPGPTQKKEGAWLLLAGLQSTIASSSGSWGSPGYSFLRMLRYF